MAILDTITQLGKSIINLADAKVAKALSNHSTSVEQTLTDLKTKIDKASTSSGESSSTTINNQDKTITENGSYTADDGYTGLGTVTVNVASSSSSDVPEVYIPLEITSDGVLRRPQITGDEEYGASWSSGSATSIDEGALQYAFYGWLRLLAVDLSNIQSIGSNGLAHAFANCTHLMNVTYFVNLTSIGSKGFYGAFENTDIHALYFPALTSDSFGNYTDQFNNMLLGVTGCTVHFPAALKSTMSSWADVTDGFGGTNTTVLFDLGETDGDGDGDGDITFE